MSLNLSGKLGIQPVKVGLKHDLLSGILDKILRGNLSIAELVHIAFDAYIVRLLLVSSKVPKIYGNMPSCSTNLYQIIVSKERRNMQNIQRFLL